MHNPIIIARETMPNGEKLRIEAFPTENRSYLEIQDTGSGTSEDFIHNNLFHPFQSAKPKRIGLGLYPAETEVESLKGKIEVESEPGKRTGFRIIFPVHSTFDV